MNEQNSKSGLVNDLADAARSADRVLLVGVPNQHSIRLLSLLREAGANITGVQLRPSVTSDALQSGHEIIAVHRDGTDCFPNLLQEWRRDGLTTPIIVLTEIGDVSLCLDSGADDCVCASIEPAELRSRLKALARRAALSPAGSKLHAGLSVHDLKIDTASKTVVRAGRLISLSPREYGLLTYLAVNRGKVVTRQSILDNVFAHYRGSNSNVVDVYIRYLRQKIDHDFALKLILTRRGYGYMLRDDGDGVLSNSHSRTTA